MTPERREAAAVRVAARRLGAEERVLDRVLGDVPLHSQQFLDEKAQMRAEQGARDDEIERRRGIERERERRASISSAFAQAERDRRRAEAEQKAGEVYRAREQYDQEREAELKRAVAAEVEANVHRRFAQLVTARDLDFSAPRTTGSGWASSRFAAAALRTAQEASRHFLECARLNLAVETERARLGRQEGGASAWQAEPQEGRMRPVSILRDLQDLREQLELAEIKFETGYAALQAVRAKAVDQQVLAKLAEADDLAEQGALDGYLTEDLPELAEVRAATEQFCRAVFALIHRHGERAELRSRALAAARAAGVAPSSSFLDPEGAVSRPLPIDTTERAVRNTAAEVARELFARSGIPNHQPRDWFPSWEI